MSHFSWKIHVVVARDEWGRISYVANVVLIPDTSCCLLHSWSMSLRRLCLSDSKAPFFSLTMDTVCSQLLNAHVVFFIWDICRIFHYWSCRLSPWRPFDISLPVVHVSFSLVIFAISFLIAHIAFLLGDLCHLFHDWLIISFSIAYFALSLPTDHDIFLIDDLCLSHWWSLSFSLQAVFSICLSVIRIYFDLYFRVAFWKV